MASIKAKFRPSKVDGKEGVIYYQIIRNRIIRQIATEYRVYSSEWDEESWRIEASQSNIERRRVLANIKERIKIDISRLNHIIASLKKQSENFSADDVVQLFECKLDGETFFAFTLTVINRLRELRKDRCVETYTTTIRSFMRF